MNNLYLNRRNAYDLPNSLKYITPKTLIRKPIKQDTEISTYNVEEIQVKI